MSDNSSNSQLPAFGGIYYIRQSVKRAFQLIYNYSGPELHQKKNVQNLVHVYAGMSKITLSLLIMASFDGVNPIIKQNDDKSIIPNISYDNLLKHLVSIYPTSPVPGRRWITIQGSDRNLMEHKNNSFLTLIPVIADSKTKWSHLLDEKFSSTDLRYIADLLKALDDEKTEQRIRNFSSEETNKSVLSDSIIPTARTYKINHVENDQKLSENDESSGESSYGSGNLFIDRIKINKSDIVQDWLHRYIDKNLDYPWTESKSE
ncbi:unnamed protein product [Rotaria socialis]|uniref:Uncharacterized protein n=2 Tax=Rotaria socialis TaxID=392032 RepID=A0A820U113_9BILA|nr:unnamed protein product [Rotaria socialis]